MAEYQKDPPQQKERTVSAHDGANSRLQPWLLSENQAAHLENLIVNDVGLRVQRAGCRSFGGVFDDDTRPGGIDWISDADYNESLIAVFGSKFYGSTGNGGWAQVASGASEISGLLHQFVRARHAGEVAWAACCCEGVTETTLGLNGRSQLVLHMIESDTETQLSLAPRCIASFQSRLFYAEEDLIGWSEIGDLSSYSDTNNVRIEPGIGGPITAIIPSRDSDPKLIIMKEGAIALFTVVWGSNGALIPTAGDELNLVESSVRLLSRGTGCIATKSAIWVPGAEGADIFFLAPDGVRSLSRAENDVQSGAGFPLSYVIPKWINRINWAAAHKAVAAVYDFAYHLAVPLDGAKDNSHILRFDISSRAWSLHSLQARDFTSARLGDVERLFMQNRFQTADTSVTEAVTETTISLPFQVYQAFSGSFDPSTGPTDVVRVVSQEETKAYSLSDPLVKKRWDSLVLQIASDETSLLEVAWRRDLGPWNTATNTIVPGTAGTVVLAEDALPWFSSAEIARRFAFNFSDIPPSYTIQFRVGGVTGMSEAGRMRYYMTEVRGSFKTDNVESDP